MKPYTFHFPLRTAHLQAKSLVFLYTMWNDFAPGRSCDGVLAHEVHEDLCKKHGGFLEDWSKLGRALANSGYLMYLEV